MSDNVIPLDAARRQALARSRAKAAKEARATKAKGVTLCGRGFHKWRIVQSKQFDVKQGRLVTIHSCERCNVRKTTLD